MPTIGMVGLGLMGASFALALKKARPELTIVGFDRDAATALKAMDRGIASAAGTDLDVVDMADVIVVAVPILAMQDVFTRLRTHVAGKVVTDVASTKGSVMEWAAGAGIDLVVGYVLAVSGRADWPEASKVAASGFRDMSRLAAGDPAMAAGIARTNRDNLLEQLDAITHSLARLRRHLEADDPRLVELFEEARSVRERWTKDSR